MGAGRTVGAPDNRLRANTGSVCFRLFLPWSNPRCDVLFSLARDHHVAVASRYGLAVAEPITFTVPEPLAHAIFRGPASAGARQRGFGP
jgi:hypothetical protein